MGGEEPVGDEERGRGHREHDQQGRQPASHSVAHVLHSIAQVDGDHESHEAKQQSDERGELGERLGGHQAGRHLGADQHAHQQVLRT